jgi:hypothetical protein
MGQLLVDRRSYWIDDVDLVDLQPVLMHALASYGSVALAVHGRDGEEHVVVVGRRPLSLRFSTEVTANADRVERMLDEFELLGSISVVASASR